MKIQCDVCNKDEASVFCIADDAALCDSCDYRVHHANKLASKHHRFSLLHPSPKQFPLCDVCQEKRAFLFCQQDRAILCKDCDLPIHSANEHTKKHNRFLLTGIKISTTSAIYTSSSSSASQPNTVSVPGFEPQPLTKKPLSVAPPNSNPPSFSKTSTTTTNKVGDNLLAIGGGGSTSSISEYLEMLPGWHVEDFLDSTSDPFGFCQSDDSVLPFLDIDLDSNMNSFPSENLGIWVPQADTPFYPTQHSSQVGRQIWFKEIKEATTMKANKRQADDAFTVPQMRPPGTGSKRSRAFC